MKRPTASVIIPFNGSPALTYTLMSLAAQQRTRGCFEVILVAENGSNINCSRREDWPFPMRVVAFRRPRGFGGHSAGLMRNLGASRAKGKYFIFLDSDCIAHPGLVLRHVNSLRHSGGAVICGAMHELSAEKQNILRSAGLPSFARLKTISLRDFRSTQRVQFSWENLYSSNVALPSEMFRKAGGFDETGFRCHDIELGYRLSRLGAECRFEKRCEVIHVEHPRLAASKLEQAKGWRLLGKKFPEIAVAAEDRALESLRNYEETVSACEARVFQIASDLGGYQIQNTVTVSPAVERSLVNHAIEGIPYIATNAEGGTVIQLGLHRNCWDYSLLLPDREALSSPAISVLIPTYNSASTIARAIASVFVQSIQNFEIIVVDDGSEDDTGNVVDGFSRDGRVRSILQSRNHGQSYCLNVGLRLARAPIALQLDADDWLESEALASVLREFREGKNIAAVYGSPLLHEQGVVRRERGYAVKTAEELLTYVPIQAPRAYSVEKLREVGGWSTSDFFEGRYFEDRRTLARLSEVGTVRYLTAPVYHCERRNDSLTFIDPEAYAQGKLLILWQQAIARRKTLEYKWNGQMVSAKFVRRKAPRRKRSWSVVIPVHNRPELLQYTLRSWEESDFQHRVAEIIVVDDGSEPAIRVEDFNENGRVRLVRLDRHSGPAVARNRGAKLAKHEFLFFCDSDHIASPDVLAGHEARHGTDSPPSVVAGGLFGAKVATFIRPSEIPGASLRRLERRFWFDARHESLMESLAGRKPVRLIEEQSAIWRRAVRETIADTFRSGWVKLALRRMDFEDYEHRWLGVGGANLSMPKKLFASFGGFDESMPPMEDWEFGARCQEMGVRIVLAPELESLHQLHPREPFFEPWARAAFARLRSKHKALVSAALVDEYVPGGAVLRQLRRLAGRANSKPRPTVSDLGQMNGVFALTFDDGPSAAGTPPVLDLLDRFGIKATFFLLCDQLDASRVIAKRVVSAGHEVGIHGWRHSEVLGVTSREAFEELRNCRVAIEDVCGVTPKFARPAFGRANVAYFDAAAQLGLTVVGAHMSVQDWLNHHEQELMFEIASNGFRSKILLFHDGVGDVWATVKAIEWMLKYARKVGAQAVTLDEWRKFAPFPKPYVRYAQFERCGQV